MVYQTSNTHFGGKITVRIAAMNSGGVVLIIEDAEGSYGGPSIFVEDAAYLDAIADAIYHYKMDRDAEAMQAASPAA